MAFIAFLTLAATPALAQDMVVMRQVIGRHAPAAPAPSAPPTPPAVVTMTCGNYAEQMIGSTPGVVVGSSSNVSESRILCAARKADGAGVCTLDDSRKVVTYHPGGALAPYTGPYRLYSMACTVG